MFASSLAGGAAHRRCSISFAASVAKGATGLAFQGRTSPHRFNRPLIAAQPVLPCECSGEGAALIADELPALVYLRECQRFLKIAITPVTSFGLTLVL